MYEPGPDTLTAARRGDPDALEEIVRGLQVPVWRFLTHLVADPGLAEDLTQETFLKVHLRLRQFRGRSRFSTWVFQIARNLGIDALRRRERQGLLPLRMGPDRPPAGAVELSTEVAAAVASLSPKLREALLLVEVLGLTYREAAVALAVPEGTAKTRVFHARRQLAAWFAADEGQERGRGGGAS